MGFLDWMKGRQMTPSKSHEDGAGWKAVNIFLYRADGRYEAATRAQTPQDFEAVIPKIRQHIDSRLEVRVTNGADHLLFHATEKGVEWDGIGLTPILDSERLRARTQSGVKEKRRITLHGIADGLSSAKGTCLSTSARQIFHLVAYSF